MTSKPTVSVIMPAYNEASTIGVQLAALTRQRDIQPTEVIVADNGSTDETVAVARSYSDRVPMLRVILADAVRGPSHARNEGAKLAVGQVLAFCDSDDEVDEGWLSALLRGLQDADLVGGRLAFDRLNSSSTIAWRDLSAARASTESGLVKVLTSNMAIRADVFRGVGMFDEAFTWGHDHEFSYRVQLAGHRCVRTPEAVVHYRIKETMRDLVRREYQDWVGAAHVHARYRDRGSPPREVWETPKSLVWLLVHLPDLLRRATAGRWLRKAAGIIGRAHGSVRYRVLYF